MGDDEEELVSPNFNTQSHIIDPHDTLFGRLTSISGTSQQPFISSAFRPYTTFQYNSVGMLEEMPQHQQIQMNQVTDYDHAYVDFLRIVRDDHLPLFPEEDEDDPDFVLADSDDDDMEDDQTEEVLSMEPIQTDSSACSTTSSPQKASRKKRRRVTFSPPSLINLVPPKTPQSPLMQQITRSSTNGTLYSRDVQSSLLSVTGMNSQEEGISIVENKERIREEEEAEYDVDRFRKQVNQLFQTLLQVRELSVLASKDMEQVSKFAMSKTSELLEKLLMEGNSGYLVGFLDEKLLKITAILNVRKRQEGEACISRNDARQNIERIQEHAFDPKICPSVSSLRNWKKRTSYPTSEDQLLLYALKELAEKKMRGRPVWNYVSKMYMPGRTPKQLSSRYRNLKTRSPKSHPIHQLLSPSSLRKECWTDEERQKIMDGYEEFGNQWNEISQKYLPHRHRKSIRREFFRLKKAKDLSKSIKIDAKPKPKPTVEVSSPSLSFHSCSPPLPFPTPAMKWDGNWTKLLDRAILLEWKSKGSEFGGWEFTKISSNIPRKDIEGRCLYLLSKLVKFCE